MMMVWRSERRLWMPFGAARGAIARSTSAPDIAFVNKSSVYVASGGATTHTLSTYAAASTGANRKLIIVTAQPSGSIGVSSVTYNAAAFTLAHQWEIAGDRTARIFFLDDASIPTDGNVHDAVVTLASSGQCIFAILEYKNVAQGAESQQGDDAQGGGAQVSIAFTSIPSGSLIVDCAANNFDTPFTPGGSQTERIDQGGTPSGIALAASDVVGASGNVTVTQTPGTGGTAYAAVVWGKAA